MGSSRMLLVAVIVAASSLATHGAAIASSRPSSSPVPKPTCRQLAKSEVITSGKLTVATNNPALAPWFVNDKPSNGKGYESAVAYHIGSILGFKASDVTWYTEPFELAEASGPKPFDFDINEITYNPKLTDDVTFSSGYFNVNQSLVALKKDRIVTHHTPKELRHYVYGALTGSPGLTYVKKDIKPVTPPIAYATIADAVTALEDKKIDAFVIDTPTGHYLVSNQLKTAVQFAQLHTTSQFYALVLQKSNPLVKCVDSAIKTLKKSGELGVLSKKYLGVFNVIPFIKP